MLYLISSAALMLGSVSADNAETNPPTQAPSAAQRAALTDAPTAAPLDPCAGIICDECPADMVPDPEGGCCACKYDCEGMICDACPAGMVPDPEGGCCACKPEDIPDTDECYDIHCSIEGQYCTWYHGFCCRNGFWQYGDCGPLTPAPTSVMPAEIEAIDAECQQLWKNCDTDPDCEYFGVPTRFVDYDSCGWDYTCKLLLQCLEVNYDYPCQFDRADCDQDAECRMLWWGDDVMLRDPVTKPECGDNKPCLDYEECLAKESETERPTSSPVELPDDTQIVEPLPCVDDETWEDTEGDNCAEYVDRQWCADGTYGPKWTYGEFWVWGVDDVDASMACCACGGGGTPAPTEEAQTPAPTEEPQTPAPTEEPELKGACTVAELEVIEKNKNMDMVEVEKYMKKHGSLDIDHFYENTEGICNTCIEECANVALLPFLEAGFDGEYLDEPMLRSAFDNLEVCTWCCTGAEIVDFAPHLFVSIHNIDVTKTCAETFGEHIPFDGATDSVKVVTSGDLDSGDDDDSDVGMIVGITFTVIAFLVVVAAGVYCCKNWKRDPLEAPQ